MSAANYSGVDLVKYIILSVLLLVSTMLQTNIVGNIEIFGVEPNLFIIMITGFALLNGPFEGAIVGFIAGLIQDVIIGNSVGGFALLGMYLGMIIGISNKRFVKDSLIIAVPFVFISTILYEAVFYIFSFYLKGDNNVLFAFRNIILPEALYNSVITLGLFPLIVYLEGLINEHGRNVRSY